MCESAWRTRSGLAPVSSPNPTPSKSPTCARFWKALASKSPIPTRRAKSSRSRAATRSRSSLRYERGRALLVRAACQRCPVLDGPGAAEQHGGPEQIARQRVLQERQGGDVALRQAGEIEAVNPAKCPDREIRDREERERAGHHDGNRRRDAAPAARHHADERRQRNRQGDDERDPPIVGAKR